MNVWELIGKLGEAMVGKKSDFSQSQPANDGEAKSERNEGQSAVRFNSPAPSTGSVVKPRKQTVEDMLRRHAEISKRIDEKTKSENG